MNKKEKVEFLNHAIDELKRKNTYICNIYGDYVDLPMKQMWLPHNIKQHEEHIIANFPELHSMIVRVGEEISSYSFGYKYGEAWFNEDEWENDDNNDEDENNFRRKKLRELKKAILA